MPLHPLFEEPTADLERTDPSEGPLGFMLGGMASLSDEQIADQYFDAATLLADAIRSGERDDYQVAYPVLFLYRHSVELQLKSTVPNTGKIHGLVQLGEMFRVFVAEKFGVEVPSWVTALLNDLGQYDPGSTAFRYGENYDKAAKRDVPLDGEVHVNLAHLQSSMTAFRAALQRVRAWESKRGATSSRGRLGLRWNLG